MSDFVPEGFTSTAPATAPAPSGTVPGGAFDAKVSKVLADPISNVPPELKKWLEDFQALNIPLIPISQIVGFTGFTAQIASYNAGDLSTASTSAISLSGGPTISGLPDGNYILLWGCEAWNDTPGNGSVMYVTTNGATGARVVTMAYIDSESMTRGTNVSLSAGGNNTVSAKYSVRYGGTATFRFRWIIALKTSNA